MNTLNRFKASLVAATVVALPILSNGCSSVTDAQGAVCCTEFKAGGTVDAKISGNAEVLTAVQAVADFSGIASAGIDDITAACRGIATDLDADKAKGDEAEANQDKQAKMKAWCDLAVSTIGTIKGKAGGTLKLVVVPPQCSLNVSAKANCSAKCSGSASCDLKANPPKCTGGSLTVSCSGSCSGSATAPSIKCEGSCSGSCSGSCTAEGGVECTGKCDGTCSASAMGGTGTGIQADGTCKGTCKGTCSVTAPSVKCSGSCKGSCDAKCEAMPGGASVKCDGTCTGDVQPLKCEGGKLEGGCMASAKCDANCDASVSAKADCTPPSISVEFQGSADVQFAGKLKAALEANLPLIFEFKERLKAMAALTATISGNADASVVGDIKAACLISVATAATGAVADVGASVSATASVVGSVGGS
jgi:hypothetical protein